MVIETLFMLAYLNNESYRRRILSQLNRGEARGSAPALPRGQEDRLGALGLVVNAIMLWNTM